jgi:cell division protein FtsB
MEIPMEQVLQAQFTKVGQLTFQLELMQQQLVALEKENASLKEELEKGTQGE